MSDTAVLVVDMMNSYQHPDAEHLDAYVRHFSVVIAQRRGARIGAELGAAALTMMERNMGAELATPPTASLRSVPSKV